MAQDPFDIDPFSDGYVEEPPAPEPTSVLREAHRPPLRQRIGREPFLRIGHRCAILGALALVAAAGTALFRRAEYWHLLLVAFLAADLALLMGVIASWLRADAEDARRREPLGLIVFSLLVLLPTIMLAAAARADRLGGWIDATWQAGGRIETWAETRLTAAATRPR